MGEHNSYRIQNASFKDESTAVAPVNQRPVWGQKAGCILCGEIRAIYDTGLVEVLIKGNAKSITTNNR